MQGSPSLMRAPGLSLPVRRRRGSAFSMTALADVLFQLLIFFMLSANLAAYSLLPLRSGALRGESGGETVGAGTAVTEASTTAIWTLNPDGIVASGQRFGIDRLQALADALALRQTQHVLIILRPDVPVQNVATVLELLSAQGISSVQIAEAPSAQRAAP
ncbi:ExbD/TolR family protein [Paracoccus sp. (in: a-proteobacteria)]|uniref:ExbD/TolR family protein n=1 Tax=Paracoccus sp. TaxID=267 RepID=UPI0035AF140D